MSASFITATGLSSPVFFSLKSACSNIKNRLDSCKKIAALMAISLIPQAAGAQATLLPFTELSVGGQTVSAEVAATEKSRNYGLMNRKSLPENHGMLFIFEHSDGHCFWMKNTPLPLSIAFIDDMGLIVNIADMQPFDETAHCPAKPVRYALEMTQGWFRSHGIKPPAQVDGLPRP